MDGRTLVYFVSDVHLGLDVNDPAGREDRFVRFLDGIPRNRTLALYLLGDIWDFWYEYRDVVPKGYSRVFASLSGLIREGVKVYFFKGNHDMWCFRYFEELGMEILDFWYKVMRKGFRSKVLQWMFSSLVPVRLAFAIGKGWSRRSRVARSEEYVFRGEEEPLYKWAVEYSSHEKVDYFIFGHFHVGVDLTIPGGSRLLILKDWMQPQSSNWILFDLMSGCLGISQNIE